MINKIKGNTEILPTDEDIIIGTLMDNLSQDDFETYLKNENRLFVHDALNKRRYVLYSAYKFKPGSRILEINAGFGNLTEILLHNDNYVVAIEQSKFRANYIEKRNEGTRRLEVVTGDMLRILLDSDEFKQFSNQYGKSFDYIIADSFITYMSSKALSEKSMKKVIKRLRKLLSCDGRLIVADKSFSVSDFIDESEIKYYFPFPSHLYTEELFSEKKMPDGDTWTKYRLRSYTRRDYLAERNLKDIQIIQPTWPDEKKIADEALSRGELWREAPAVVVEITSGESESISEEWGFPEYSKTGDTPKKLLILSEDQDTELIDAVRLVQLELLDEFIRVCKKYDLSWTLMYGSMLGAIRRGAVVYGDDDIDVALPRADYDKMIAVANKEFTGKFFLQTPENDDAFFGGYSKLRNRETTALNHQNWWTDCCEGIFIDIFPIDNSFDSVNKEREKQKKIRFYQRILFAKAYGYYPCFRDMQLLEWKSYKYLGKLMNKETVCKKLSDAQRSGDENSAKFGIYTHYYEKCEVNPRVFDRKCLDELMYVPFEQRMCSIPVKHEELLRTFYGENYLQQIPFDIWKLRHGFYDVDRPYSVYKHRFRDIFRPMPEGKQIVLIGDGLCFDAYFKKYRDANKVPDRIVLVDPKAICEKVEDIETENDAVLAEMDPSEIYPIICAIDIKGTSQVLEQYGINDYYYFVDDRNTLMRANNAVDYACRYNEWKHIND